MSRASEELQRLRRIETRVTQMMVALGIDVGQKPVFKMVDVAGEKREAAVVDLPSPHSSLKEVLDNIPASWDGPVGVFVGDRLVATIHKQH